MGLLRDLGPQALRKRGTRQLPAIRLRGGRGRARRQFLHDGVLRTRGRLREGGRISRGDSRRREFHPLSLETGGDGGRGADAGRRPGSAPGGIRSMPRVSVVMPVHNGARYLAEALESVFAQTFRDFEVIVVDDGSTDETPAILRGYGDRLAVISREQGGACAARNLGAERTAAPYVAFLDHDDRWYPRKLEQQTAVLDARPEVVLVLSESDRMDEQGRLIQTRATAAERPRLKDSPLGRLMETDQLLSSAI